MCQAHPLRAFAERFPEIITFVGTMDAVVVDEAGEQFRLLLTDLVHEVVTPDSFASTAPVHAFVIDSEGRIRDRASLVGRVNIDRATVDSDVWSGFMLAGMDDLMPIGDFSALTGLSPRRLRSYAAGGLLVPAAVDATTGYRYYSPGQMHEALVIDALRRAGMPVAGIAALLEDPSPEHLAGWERELRVEASDRQEALRAARRLLGLDAEPHPARAHESSRRETMTTLHTAARTDIGRVREHNEDALLCADELVAVADGLGGNPGGEVASSLAVALLETAFARRSIDELEAAVRAASRAISEHARSNAELEGMATTMCAAGLTTDRQLAVVNVGDSRAYLLREGSLRQLTQDHTVTADLVRRGELTEDEAIAHPYRHVLTRALGAGPTVDVDGQLVAATPADRLLLCTDGLFNEVPDHDIANTIQTTNDIDAAADALMNQALANGGHDNITIVLADISA